MDFYMNDNNIRAGNKDIIATIYRIKAYDSKCMDNFVLDLFIFC